MTTGNHKTGFCYLVGSLIVTLIIAGCAAQSNVEYSPPPPSGSADGSVEEIVVSDNRRSKPDANRQGRTSAGAAMVAPESEPMMAATALSYDEELWVISRPDRGETNDDSAPGSGAMVAHFPRELDQTTGRTRVVPLPLQHTAVNATIDGYISTVDVQQSFTNPFDQKIEAVYLFPLPEKAAVNEFVMTIGERRIRGILREKEEAAAIYQEARRQGYQASLLVQHRPNVFEQKVANIEPGKAIDIDIRYFHTLPYEDGWYSFVFPTVVGPRYNPPGSADPIRPVARGESAGNDVALPYLRPDERSAHDISFDVTIDAGVAIEELKSTHEIEATRSSASVARVRLAAGDTLPNRDFVLRFRVAGEQLRSNLMTYEDPATGQGYFSMMLYPPQTTSGLERRPMEMVFVLDCSGSMNGRPLQQAKQAVYAALKQLRPDDTFQIIRFSNNSSQLGVAPIAATPENLKKARRYLQRLNGTGGTQMIAGIKAALDFPHDPERLRFVTFMTDGFIGNEATIIAAVHDKIGDARIFSFGVGSSVNRYLLERMAKEGRGAVAYLGPQDSAADIMSRFFSRVSHPALTDVRIDWGGMTVSDVYPALLPDVFVGRAVVVTGKFSGTPGGISVSGFAGHEQTFDVLHAATSDSSANTLPSIWARLRIADLADRLTWESDPYNELAAAIRQTALRYQLVSDYTSFVAVDAATRTHGEFGVTVPQAVPVPDGVRYETTIGNEEGTHP